MTGLEEINNELEYEEELVPKVRVSPKFHYSLEKTHSYFQEQIALVEPKLHWNNKDYFKDRARLYASAWNCRLRKGESSAVSILNWAREKQPHVRALISVLDKE